MITSQDHVDRLQQLHDRINRAYRAWLVEHKRVAPPPPGWQQPEGDSGDWRYEIELLVFGGARIVWTEGVTVAFGYDYDNLSRALIALYTHTEDVGAEEVRGWVRAYPPYYRHRPDGESASEYVTP